MNNNDTQILFNELMDSFSLLTPKQKKEEIIKKLRFIGETLYNLNIVSNKQEIMLSSKYLSSIDVNNEYDFLNGIYSLTHFIENELGKNLYDNM